MRELHTKLLNLVIGFYALCITYSAYAEVQKQKIQVDQLKGYEVKFDYTHYPKEREAAYEYYKQNYKFDEFHPLDKSNIGIDLRDVNNDGTEEIITYLQNGGYCGSSGCRFHILKRDGSNADLESKVKYNSIAQGQIYPNIKILETNTSGYHHLLIEDKRGSYIWEMSGTIYKVSKEIEEHDWGKGCSEDAFGEKREVPLSVSHMQRGAEISNKYGFLGFYQMDKNVLKSIGYIDKVTNEWIGKYGINKEDDFLKDMDVQNIAVCQHHKITWEKYLQDYHKYDSLQVGGVVLSQSGMISAAHLVGYLGLKSFVDNKGVVDIRNGNLVNPTEYLKRFGGYIIDYNAEDFLKKLHGTKVYFDYHNYPAEREILYQFQKRHEDEIETFPLQKYEIGIFPYDIDNDGENEILVYYNNRGFCGSLGCSFYIFKPLKNLTEDKKCELIFGYTTSDHIQILKSSNSGYQDLLLFDPWESRIWSWDGQKYDLYKKNNNTKRSD